MIQGTAEIKKNIYNIYICIYKSQGIFCSKSHFFATISEIPYNGRRATLIEATKICDFYSSHSSNC